uniref:Translocase of outer mitochondrial membrane 40 homolog, like n=1 Tax=Xiphophorus couchianus TaxID=32473 RepID=A0A3B5KTC7_9TELE
MGSVLAASAAPAPPLPPGFGLPPLPPPATGSGPQREAKNVLPNPGAFEQCHQKVFPTQVNGVRLVLNKALSKHFQLSSTEDSGYRFGTVFVGSGQAGPAEFYPVLVGDVDSSGSLNAQVIHRVTDRIRSKVVFQQTHQQTFVTWKADTEFRGEDFTAAVAFTNPDVLDDSHYLQSVTPALAMGGHLVYRRRPGDEASFLSLVGRYTSNFVGALTLGWASVQASYYHRASDKLQLGVELETGAFLEDSSVTFGYQLDVPEANLQFKVINSNWVVGATLEKKLLPLPLSLVLCSFLNHQKNKFHCGFGVV